MRLMGLVLLLFVLVGCQPFSKEQRAFLNLQADVINCQKQAMTVSCQQKIDEYILLAHDAKRLQKSPQKFGQEILSIQMQLAELNGMSRLSLKKIEKQKLELKLRRLIRLVAILESP